MVSCATVIEAFAKQGKVRQSEHWLNQMCEAGVAPHSFAQPRHTDAARPPTIYKYFKKILIRLPR